MSELCVWDLDGTMRPGNLMADAINHAAGIGIIDINRFVNPEAPDLPELIYFVGAIAQQSRRQFTDLTDRLSDEAPSQIYPWALERLESQPTRGDHPIVVSQSPDFLVRAFGRGIDAVRHSGGSHFETKALNFSGKAITLDKLNAAKRYTREKGFNKQFGFAAGDSFTDVPILKSAKAAAVVNPNQNLYELAKEHGWEIIAA
jgi:phosphoserine phosphatase